MSEIKFHQEPIGLEILKEMRQKLKALPRGHSIRPVLIHVNGVKPEIKQENSFSHIIDFGSFLKEK